MKIVIDIPEEVYYGIIDGTENTWDALDLILKSKILPKGHGRLIDERLLREDMERAYKYANELVALGFAESFLEHAPTIIEADKEGAEE